MQVAVVDAHQRCFQGEGIVHFLAVVNLDQHVQANFMGDAFQLLHLVPGQAGGDQQDAVGANSPALVDLIRRHHEVLADDRQAAGGAGGLEVVFMTLEEILVSEY